MKSKYINHGTLFVCAVLLIAGCRTHRDVATAEMLEQTRSQTAQTVAHADTARTEIARTFNEETRHDATAWDSVQYFIAYDGEGRISAVSASRRTAQSGRRANSRQQRAVADVATNELHRETTRTDSVKHEATKETAQTTEAGGNVLSTIDKAAGIAMGLAGLVFCVWAIYRLRKLSEKWEKRDQ